MDVYISSHDEYEAANLADFLTKNGQGIASRWVTSKTSIHEATDEVRTSRVLDNIEDIKFCDALVVIAAPAGELVPGGKHFETGYAIAIGKPVYLLGRRENLYHRHPMVFLVADTGELLSKLGE